MTKPTIAPSAFEGGSKRRVDPGAYRRPGRRAKATPKQVGHKREALLRIDRRLPEADAQAQARWEALTWLLDRVIWHSDTEAAELARSFVTIADTPIRAIRDLRRRRESGR